MSDISLSVAVKPTCVVLVALGGLTQQLGYGGAHSLGAGTQILGAFLKLNNTAKRYRRKQTVIYSVINKFLPAGYVVIWEMKPMKLLLTVHGTVQTSKEKTAPECVCV